MFRPRLPLILRPSLQRWSSSAQRVFGENDTALLRPVLDPTKTYLTRPLVQGKTSETYRGLISHDDIIGKRPRDIVATRKGVKFWIAFPTLEEYILSMRRLVTPIYPIDAATIVSLLDIHVTRANHDNDGCSSEEEPVEVLEAGTGLGSLTLYLSRALSPCASAILHTMDVSAKHSAHARKVISNFRRGIYLPNIRFYVCDPGAWCREQLSVRDGKPFLTHAILDLPGPEEYLFDVMRCLRPDGVVGIWCPSVSQIMVAVASVKGSGLFCERVLEFPGGTGVGAGLRAWDVRPAVIRARVKEAEGMQQSEGGVGVTTREEPTPPTPAAPEQAPPPAPPTLEQGSAPPAPSALKQTPPEPSALEQDSPPPALAAPEPSPSAPATPEPALPSAPPALEQGSPPPAPSDLEQSLPDPSAIEQAPPPSVSVPPTPALGAFICRPTVGDRLVGGGFFAIFRRKSSD